MYNVYIDRIYIYIHISNSWFVFESRLVFFSYQVFNNKSWGEDIQQLLHCTMLKQQLLELPTRRFNYFFWSKSRNVPTQKMNVGLYEGMFQWLLAKCVYEILRKYLGLFREWIRLSNKLEETLTEFWDCWASWSFKNCHICWGWGGATKRVCR